MSKKVDIRRIKNKDIDPAKWDQCIKNSENRRVYAFSWYLDMVANHWDALVMGDYEYVMPVPFKHKFGIAYVYQPFFCQQLGVFPTAPASIQHKFIEVLKQHFPYVDYHLNSAHHQLDSSTFSWYERTNYAIPLVQDYQSIKSGYTKHAKRNLKNAKDAKVVVVKGLHAEEYLAFKKASLKTKVAVRSLEKLSLLMKKNINTGRGVIYGAYSEVNNLCAAAFFLFDGNRVYYLNAFSTDEGRENRAMYALVDTLIKQYASTGRILDFEGSGIEGVARFYKGFGALQEKYFHIHLNHLPLPFKWLKK